MVIAPQNAIFTLFCDLDGVLVALDPILEKLEGRSMDRVRIEDARPDDPKFDPYIAMMRKHAASRPFVIAEPTPEFQFFMNKMVEWKAAGHRVEILSSGTRHEDLYEDVCNQKMQWLTNHGVDKVVDKINLAKGGSTKALWASPTTILIDDYIKNINSFREAGGIAIHHTSVESTQLQLRALGL